MSISEEDGPRCVRVSPSVPLQIESNPLHFTFQCHYSVSRTDCGITCISERNQTHIWLGHKYSTTLVSDDVISLTKPFFEPELPYPTVLVVSLKTVYWFVCGEEGHWELAWSYACTRVVSAITAVMDRKNNSFSIDLLFNDKLLRMTDIIIETGDNVIFNSDNSVFREFVISFSTKNIDILSMWSCGDQLIICTSASLSLRNLTDSKVANYYNPNQNSFKDCIYVLDIGLIVVLTDTGQVIFIDSYTLTLCDEWREELFEGISLLSEGDSYFLVCQRSEVFNVFSLKTLETVASYSATNMPSLLINSNYLSHQFCFYSLDSDFIFKLHFCDLSLVSNEVNLERTMLNFSLMQACWDQGFDWVTEVIDNISFSQFQTACYLLWKHYDCIQLEITENIFALLLNKIPVVNSLDGVILWLKSLLLFISLQQNSKRNYFTQFLAWTENYIENLEKTFPENWIQLSLKLVQFLNTQISAIDAWETNKRLAIVQNQIEDIQIVFNTLNIRLSFSRIADYSLSSFLHELLRHAHSPEQIRSLLTSKIISIINRHGESLDNVLYNYILSLGGKLDQEMYLAELLESKAMAVTKHISSNDLKHKSALFLLRNARLPINKKLLEFAINVESSTRMSMQHEIELVRVLSIFRENSFDIPVLHSHHQLTDVIQTLQVGSMSTEIPDSICSLAKHASFSDHRFSYLMHSTQLISPSSFEEESYSKSYHLLPLISRALISAKQTFPETEILLKYLNQLRFHLTSHEYLQTNKYIYYIEYFENLFKGVFLFHHLKEFQTDLSLPILIDSQPNTRTFSHLISNIPGTKGSDVCFTSPAKKVKLNSDPWSLFKNFHQLSKSHRIQICSKLLASALELSDINSAILILQFGTENEIIDKEHSVSNIILQFITKLPLILPDLEEPVETLTKLENFLESSLSADEKHELVDCLSLLIRTRLMKDVIFQSEFEIKPKLSQQQERESRRLFRNHSYQEKGYILDKSSATNCVLSLSRRNPSISPNDSASVLLTLKNLFLPQTALRYLILSLFSTRSLTVSPDLLNIPSSLLSSLLRNSPIDITYILSLLVCIPEDEAKRELFSRSKTHSSSPSWFLSIAWIGLYYQELVALHSFKPYATNAISSGQYITFIRSVTRQKLDSQCNEWTPQFILHKLLDPLFSPDATLSAAQLFSLDSDRELLRWVRSAVGNRWGGRLVREAVSLLGNKYESLNALYQSGDIPNFEGIRLVLESILQLEQAADCKPLLYRAECLVSFLISSESPFLTKSTESADNANASLLGTDQLTFNDLLGENAWSLIKDFLSFQYLDIYLGLTAYLDIQSDRLISNTIKAEVLHSISQARSLGIQQVKPYLEKLGTKEIQIAASRWLGSNMELIEDRMEAILFAINAAEQWKEASVVSEIQKAREAHETLEAHYKMLKVRLWLSELGINEDSDSANLYQEPRELIRLLINSYKPDTVHQCTKLYQIIRDIAQLFSLDIDTVISDSISSLISSQRELRSLNNSFSFCIEGDTEEEQESLTITSNIYTQLIVLLSVHSQDVDMHVNNLINIAVRDSKAHSYNNRKAAVQLAIILISHHSNHQVCFSKFVLDIFTQVTFQFDSVVAKENCLLSLHSLLELLCIVEELELLGYPMGIGTFLQSSKLAVIQGLVRNFAESFQAFELAARIGMLLYSKVPDAIWKEVLEKLCLYKRYAFLLTILPKLIKHISSDFLTPLTFSVLTHVPLTLHISLFPHFIQLAHTLPQLTTDDRNEFINTIGNIVSDMKAIGQESYAPILEHLVQSQSSN